MEAHSRGTIGAAVFATFALGLAVACARPAPRAHIVEIRGFAYLPAMLEVAAGDTIVWLNRDAVPHTATPDGQAWDSESIDVEQSWRLVAAPRGSHPYYCTFHPSMRGELVVR